MNGRVDPLSLEEKHRAMAVLLAGDGSRDAVVAIARLEAALAADRSNRRLELHAHPDWDGHQQGAVEVALIVGAGAGAERMALATAADLKVLVVPPPGLHVDGICCLACAPEATVQILWTLIRALEPRGFLPVAAADIQQVLAGGDGRCATGQGRELLEATCAAIGRIGESVRRSEASGRRVLAYLDGAVNSSELAAGMRDLVSAFPAGTEIIFVGDERAERPAEAVVIDVLGR